MRLAITFMRGMGVMEGFFHGQSGAAGVAKPAEVVPRREPEPVLPAGWFQPGSGSLHGFRSYALWHQKHPAAVDRHPSIDCVEPPAGLVEICLSVDDKLQLIAASSDQ